MSAEIVRSIGLGRTYRTGGGAVEALRDVSFCVERGEMLALRGPSGSGKSTLLSLLACADRPTAGSLALNGRNVERLSDRSLRDVRRRDLGIVFQNFHLLGALSVRENVSLPLVLLGRNRADVNERVNDVLERVGVDALADRLPRELSGGQAQRVAIARAVVHEPALVLADEPTGNLDWQTGAAVVALLRSIASAGQTVVVATHAEPVAAVCDRTVWLRDGTVSKRR